MDRRELLRGAAGAVVAACLPVPALAAGAEEPNTCRLRSLEEARLLRYIDARADVPLLLQVQIIEQDLMAEWGNPWSPVFRFPHARRGEWDAALDWLIERQYVVHAHPVADRLLYETRWWASVVEAPRGLTMQDGDCVSQLFANNYDEGVLLPTRMKEHFLAGEIGGWVGWDVQRMLQRPIA